MKRKDFLKGIGAIGVGSLIASKTELLSAKVNMPPACVLIPTETAGPFPLDLTENNIYFRKDIKETKTGAPLKVTLKIIGTDNCQPMTNVRVNIWHCDKDGLYSGYSENNNPGQAGLTYCRGYQFTDANGVVEFNTIFPGWYNGRICHIHFQVYVSSIYAAISQLTFPLTEKNNLYTANTNLYTKGVDPMTFAQDNIFSDGYNYQLATLTQNTTTGGYECYLEVAVKGSGTTGYAALEPETGGYFKLGQSYPNPFKIATTIPFSLLKSGNVKIQIWDTNGKLHKTIDKGKLEIGDYQFGINLKDFDLPIQNYVYQLVYNNADGEFRQAKMMTVSN